MNQAERQCGCGSTPDRYRCGMRRIIILVLFAITVAACSSTDGEPVSTTTPDTTTAVGSDVPPQLADHEVKAVQVGDRTMTLAIADSPALRAQGLMQVEGLGDLDGMLFYWRHDASGGFWMKDTLIPLDMIFIKVRVYSQLAEGQTTQTSTLGPGLGSH